MRLPIEQFTEDVCVPANVALLDIVVQVELYSSPFVNLGICLVGNQLQDFLAKLWDFEVSTCTVDFSEDTFVLRTLAVESGKG